MNNSEYRRQAIAYLEEYGFDKESLVMLYDETITLSDEQVKQYVRYLIDGISDEVIRYIFTGGFSEIQSEELRRGFQEGFPLQLAMNEISSETKAIDIRRMVNFYMNDIQKKEDIALSDVIGKIGAVAEHIEADRKEYKEVCDEINAAITKRDMELEDLRNKFAEKENSSAEDQYNLLKQENELIRVQNNEFATSLKEAAREAHQFSEKILQIEKEKIRLEIRVEGLIAENSKLNRKMAVIEGSQLEKLVATQSKLKEPIEHVDIQMPSDKEKKTSGIVKFFNRVGGKKDEPFVLPESEKDKKLLLIRFMKEKQFTPEQMKEITRAYESKIDFEVIIKIIRDGFTLEQMQEVFTLLDAGKNVKDVVCKETETVNESVTSNDSTAYNPHSLSEDNYSLYESMQ
ncbi:MAG TPA: hypothetical protein DCE48_12160 [Lachnospiraceae bacterium]|uniref:hypothetical protein n=1 Tax=Anaerosporobacter sp. TaxID=1872529 RepID=UPI000EBA26E7|nr:hypothetical protein [Anaerosporobacter sp.]HAB61424.1 hypothetical protein [Lachnospiraceae bacterium]